VAVVSYRRILRRQFTVSIHRLKCRHRIYGHDTTAIDDKLQGSAATCLRCGGVVNNQVKKGLLLSV